MRSAKPMTGVMVGCVLVLGASSSWAQDWPQFRGPNRDNKVTGFTAPATWPKELTEKWKVPVGFGDASPALVGDKLYVFTRQGGDEVTTCLDAASGKVVWEDKHAAEPVKGSASSHPGPRSTPAVAEGKVCTLGVAGVVSCLDAATGKVVWRKDTKAKPQFYTSTSPVIVDGKCVVFAGALTAYELASGDEKWKWADEGASYGSPIVMTIDGTKQVVTLSDKSLVGIAAADGKLLWKVAFSAGRYQTPTPIAAAGQTVICGAQAFMIEKKGDAYGAKPIWKGQAPATYNTPVLKDGLLFGLAASGKATSLYCANAQTGEVLWTDKTTRGECGTILDAGSVLLLLTSDTNLVAFQPNNKEYMEVAKYKVADKSGLEGPWAYPIVSGKRVFVKDREALTLWTIE